MASLLYKFLQACCRSDPHFMSVLKIVNKSPGSHDKVIYIIFFAMLTSLTKLQYMVEPEISSLVVILCFICNPYPGCISVKMTDQVFTF